jgi:hypothetical protein
MHRLQLTLILALGVAASGTSAQPAAGVENVLARVGEKIADYYKRVQNVICIEKFTVQPIGHDYAPDGFARITESELRVETDPGDGDGDGGGEAKVVRVLRKVNGRIPRENERKDKRDSAGCTDPNPLSPEPLTFLLPSHRPEYTFALVGPGKGRDRDTVIVAFKSIAPRQARPQLVESSKEIDNCYSVDGDIPTQGRVWIDVNTYDVVQVEEHLMAPIDLRIAEGLRRKRQLTDLIVLERYDAMLRFRNVVFHEPDEQMLLPESIVNVIGWRGGMQSSRRTQQFSDYRRFLTAGRVVK